MEVGNSTFNNAKELFNVTFGNLKFPKPLSKLLNVNKVRLKRVKSELKIPLIFRKLEQRNSKSNPRISDPLLRLLHNQDTTNKRKCSVPRVLKSEIILRKEASTERVFIKDSYASERGSNKLNSINFLPTMEKTYEKLNEGRRLIRLFSKNFLFNSGKQLKVHNIGLNDRCVVRPRIMDKALY